jgi:hypothetical protein
MTAIKIMAAAAVLATLALASVAQGEEEKVAPIYTYATYFNCPGGPLKIADKEIADDAARMDGLVKNGTILGWGYLSHHTGGHWQRALYFQAQGLNALMDAYDATGDTGDDDAADQNADLDFGQICNNHDDYIWEAAGGTPPGTRGKVGFSVYFVCDSAREDRADEIVMSHVAPVLNKLVKDGKLTSWGWQKHEVGGHFRRLQTMTGKDYKSLLAARAEAIDMIYDDSAEGKELGSICSDHVDYMWNIVHETR